MENRLFIRDQAGCDEACMSRDFQDWMWNDTCRFTDCFETLPNLFDVDAMQVAI